MASLEEFKSKFQFNPQYALLVGAERECHLLRDGRIVPIAQEVLNHLWARTNGRGCCYGYELSGCQLEERTAGPTELSCLKSTLLENEAEIVAVENELGFTRAFLGAAPEDMPLDHYPCERYDRIVSKMNRSTLLAACRVTGVHILIGMPSHAVALNVYNQVIKHFTMLCRAGCVTGHQRLQIYEQVVNDFGVPDWHISPRLQLFLDHLVEIREPPPYESWEQFYERACHDGFVDDPRRLWDFIRISVHGAIEFRMFDTTADIDKVVAWAVMCHGLCKVAMAA